MNPGSLAAAAVLLLVVVATIANDTHAAVVCPQGPSMASPAHLQLQWSRLRFALVVLQHQIAQRAEGAVAVTRALQDKLGDGGQL